MYYIYVVYRVFNSRVYLLLLAPILCTRRQKVAAAQRQPTQKEKEKNEKMKQMKLKMCRKIALPFSSRIIPAPLVV